jgi:hypothetical protein
MRMLTGVTAALVLIATGAEAAVVVNTGTWTSSNPLTFTAGQTWNSTANLNDVLDICYSSGTVGVAHVATGGNVTATGLSMAQNRRGLLVLDGAMAVSGGLYAGRGTGESRIVVRNNGSFTMTNSLQMGFQAGSSTSDLVIQDSGAVVMNSTGALFVGGGAGATGTVTQTGGSLETNAKTLIQGINGAVGAYVVSGGSINVTSTARTWEVGFSGATSGSGLFQVIGSNVALTAVQHLKVHPTGTLAFTVNDAGGTSVVNASDFLVATGTLDMDLDGYTPSMGAIFDLVAVTSGTVDTAYANLNLAPEDVGVWQLVNPAGGKTLQVQYLVPEPASLLLLAVSGLAMLRRRR